MGWQRAVGPDAQRDWLPYGGCPAGWSRCTLAVPGPSAAPRRSSWSRCLGSIGRAQSRCRCCRTRASHR
eukprot:4142767-Alexandrium_andersonii.AAC.1